MDNYRAGHEKFFPHIHEQSEKILNKKNYLNTAEYNMHLIFKIKNAQIIRVFTEVKFGKFQLIAVS